MTIGAGGAPLLLRWVLASVLVVSMDRPAIARSLELPLFAFPSSAATAEWQTVNDGVMGGVSDGRFRITDRQTLEFHGTLSLENNGGFASVRSRPRTLGLQTADTLHARVRGDGREYQLHLYTPSRRMAFSYRAPVPTRTSEWTEVRIPLDRFEATSFGRVMREAGPVDPDRVASVGFLLADGTPAVPPGGGLDPCEAGFGTLRRSREKATDLPKRARKPSQPAPVAPQIRRTEQRFRRTFYARRARPPKWLSSNAPLAVDAAGGASSCGQLRTARDRSGLLTGDQSATKTKPMLAARQATSEDWLAANPPLPGLLCMSEFPREASGNELNRPGSPAPSLHGWGARRHGQESGSGQLLRFDQLALKIRACHPW